jgi:hypothetical protein
MHGGWLHTRFMADHLERAAIATGGTVHTEHRVQLVGRIGFIDLLVVINGRRIAIEVENTAHRVEADVEKAGAAGADTLFIVTPTTRTADSCVRKLRRLGLFETQSSPPIKVCTLHVALQELANFGQPNVPTNTTRQKYMYPNKDTQP